MIFKYFWTMMMFNLFMLIYNPLLMSLTLILLTLSIMINVYNSNNNMWFSYMLCLIYLGGVLILFIYISSFLPNIKMVFIPMIIMFFFWSIFLMIFKYSILKNEFFFNSCFMSYNMIFEKNMMMFFLMSLFYLIFTLVMTVYYSSFNKMPLRSIF